MTSARERSPLPSPRIKFSMSYLPGRLRELTRANIVYINTCAPYGICTSLIGILHRQYLDAYQRIDAIVLRTYTLNYEVRLQLCFLGTAALHEYRAPDIVTGSCGSNSVDGRVTPTENGRKTDVNKYNTYNFFIR
jgi:hypothetical protein